MPPRERGATETRPCAACGNLLTRLVSQAHGRFWYCDHKCQIAHAPTIITISKERNPYRGQKETRPCGQCGELVTRYLNPRNVEKTWYCSVTHRAEGESQRRVREGTWVRPQKPRRGDTINCEWCGEPVYRQPAYIKQHRRFCSEEHWNEAQRAQAGRIEKVCAYCGAPFSVPPSKKGQAYCKRACQVSAKTKTATGRMHNGRPVITNGNGYLLIYEPTHPKASKGGRVLEHRWVMEQHLGRYLRTDEQVDHIQNDRKWDNSLSNLQLLSPGDHTRKTQEDRMREVRGLRERVKRLEQLEEEAKRRDAEIATLRAQLHAPVLS